MRYFTIERQLTPNPINTSTLPILYVGDFLLSHLSMNNLRELFARDVQIADNDFSLMMAIMATLSNKGCVDELIELYGLMHKTHLCIRRVIIEYATKDTYLALTKNVLGTFSWFENLKHRDLVLYLMKKRKDDYIFWKSDPSAFSASEYVKLALKSQLKYPKVSANERLILTIYDLLARGEEYKARELSSELKRRGLSYKYDWDNDDPLSVWERAT